MSNLYYTAQYKNNIINLLLKNDMFRRLLNPKTPPHEELDVIDVLIGGEWMLGGKQYKLQGYVFDYVFADNTTTDVKPFVFVEGTNGVIDDYGMITYDLFIYVCCEKTMMTLNNKSSPTAAEVKQANYFATDRANRVDTLCDCIDRIINRNTKIKGIGDIKPAKGHYVSPYTPNNNYYGKVLSYRIKNLDTDGDTCDN